MFVVEFGTENLRVRNKSSVNLGSKIKFGLVVTELAGLVQFVSD